MNLFGKKKLLFLFTLLHIIGYYTWIFYWENNEWVKTLGGNVFSILAAITAASILTLVSKKLGGKEKYYWLLIAIGCISYVIAEATYIYYESYLQIEVPFPGWPDLFYMLHIVFYLLAFLLIIRHRGGSLHLVKFIFDTCIIMIVAVAFSWHFILQDIIKQEHVSNLSFFVSLGYPVGDLILLLGAISFYLGYKNFLPPRVLYLTIASFLFQIYADTVYLYLSTNDIYFSGGHYDPLWSLALLLMAISGAFAVKDSVVNIDKISVKKDSIYSIREFISLRLLLPYISVMFLFMVMVFQRGEINGLIVGSAFAILLVIFRQIFTLLENQTLLSKYHKLNEELEQKIGERTKELSEKNLQLISAVQKMKHMAYHDVLSGLPNRRLFLEQLNIAITEAKQSNYQLGVVFIDLDRFKIINDTLGHEFGDLVLKHVSKRMLEMMRSVDTLSRQGGDEFTILLNNVSSKSEIIPLIEYFQAIITNPFHINGYEFHISMSMGISMYPTDGQTAEELMKHADMAMYQAKGESGNNYKFFSADMNEVISRKMTLETGLRKAIANDEFVLHYQPQINLVNEEIIGVEALIRWNSKEFGMVSPGEFIPLAEESRLIIPIGEWVLFTACRQAKAWHDSGNRELKLAVNISPLQFLNDNLVSTVANALEKTGFDPQSLEIEITEGVAVYDAEEAILKMQALRDLGVRISIDDFGTGYSSLIYLKRFPINTLKIAQPFVQDMTNNNSDESLVEAMISMAHSLKLSVVAEGVETIEQLQILKELQCDAVQGYVYSKPLTVEELNMRMPLNMHTH